MSVPRITRRRFLQTAAAAAAGTALGACSNGRRPCTLPKPDRIFFITLDTVRSDQTELFGYCRSTMPFLARLSRRSVLFENAYCSCNNTNPSHTSMFTGLYIGQHNVKMNAAQTLAPQVRLLPDYLHGLGYDSAGFASVIWMQLFTPRFRHFDTHLVKYVPKDRSRIPYRQCPDTLAQAAAWCAGKTPADKFLLWTHLYDPHDPYHPPEDLRRAMTPPNEAARSRLIAHWQEKQKKDPGTFPWLGDADKFVEQQVLYDAELRFVDRELERFYNDCEARGLNRNSLWIVTADHGEGLGTHGYTGHGMHLYQPQLHVMLMFHTPDGSLSPGRLGDLTHHVDLMPTFGELFGAQPAHDGLTIEGSSLLPLLEGRGALPEDRIVFAQRRIQRDGSHTEEWEPDPIYAAVSLRSKLIDRPSADEFYDLGGDPLEQRNAIDANPPGLDRMRTALGDWVARTNAEGAKIAVQEEAPIAPELQQQLETLGYFGNTGQAAAPN